MSAAIDDFLAAQGVPGVIAMGVDRMDWLYSGAFGYADLDKGLPMELDTPCSIMSMTKPVTSLAIMMLVEQGALGLDDPAVKYVPEYRDIKVITNVDRKAGTFEAVVPRSDFTIRQLLVHTAGFGYSFCHADLFALKPESDGKLFGLVHHPGEAWNYGISTQVLGEVAEAITGKALFDVFREMIFEPLGMNNTCFGNVEGMAVPHVPIADGSWRSIQTMEMPGRGDTGLVGTAPDYARFLQCLLNEGAPLVSADTFRRMISNQLGDLFVEVQPAADPSFTVPFPEGAGVDKFGFGFQLHVDPLPGRRSTGSYSWCGLFNTFFWGDPVQQIGGIVLMQTMPLYHPDCLATLQGFEQRLYSMVR